MANVASFDVRGEKVFVSMFATMEDDEVWIGGEEGVYHIDGIDGWKYQAGPYTTDAVTVVGETKTICMMTAPGREGMLDWKELPPIEVLADFVRALNANNEHMARATRAARERKYYTDKVRQYDEEMAALDRQFDIDCDNRN